MKVFTHNPVSLSYPDLDTVHEDGKRYYITPQGNKYASITTILSGLSKQSIDKWKNRIGLEEAFAISTHASDRGTNLHACLESYIKNQEVIFPKDNPKVRLMFNKIKWMLSEVDNIVGQELPLFSDTWRTAGRTDLIANYKGIPSILDFKGTSKAKKVTWITGYFLQATAYSLMFEELTGLKHEQIVIMMAGEDDLSKQAFIEDRNKYIEPLKEVIDNYYMESKV